MMVISAVVIATHPINTRKPRMDTEVMAIAFVGGLGGE
jgi:hypothetical protein